MKKLVIVSFFIFFLYNIKIYECLFLYNKEGGYNKSKIYFYIIKIIITLIMISIIVAKE